MTEYRIEEERLGGAHPTDADFAAATSYLQRFHAETDDSFWTLEERAVAQALADQRARYEAVASELDDEVRSGRWALSSASSAQANAALRIRQVGA